MSYNLTLLLLEEEKLRTVKEEPVPYLPGMSCNSWLPAQNVTFHASMLLFAAAFFVPVSFKHYIITLRSLLIVALVIFIVWDVLYWCTMDLIIWSVVFILENLAQLAYALHKIKRVTFPADIESVYSELFAPFEVTRREFKALINQNCKWVNIFPGDKYAVEGHTTVEARVSLLVSGCMRVTYKGVFLHDVKDRQMIDSCEWDVTKLRRGEIFQVTTEAIDRCFYFCWNREKLQFYLQADPKLKKAFDYLRGKDILEKVYTTALNASNRAQRLRGHESERHVTATDIREGLAEEDPSLIYN